MTRQEMISGIFANLLTEVQRSDMDTWAERLDLVDNYSNAELRQAIKTVGNILRKLSVVTKRNHQ